MTIHPMFAFLDQPWIILIIVVLAALLFGADRLPKLARSAGQAKKEFLAGQAEADAAQAKAAEDARLAAKRKDADLMNYVEVSSSGGQSVPPPTPDKGTPSS